MLQIDEEVIEILNQSITDISTLGENDQDTLINIGISLEQIPSRIPEDISGCTALINLCLEGLQAIYQNEVTNFQNLINALSEAIKAIVQHLQSEDLKTSEVIMKKAWHTLWDTLEKKQQNCEQNPEEKTNDDTSTTDLSNFTLDDVGAFLVQLDTNDYKGLTKVQTALNNIADRESTSPSVQRRLIQASQQIDEIVQRKPDNADKIYAEVSELIEAAMDAAEDKASDNLQPQKQSTAQPQTKENIQFEFLLADADLSLIGEFITESREYLEGAETALLNLEKNPEDLEAVNTIFRAFHTIKGTSAFLGLTIISEFAHRAESFLSRIRDGEIYYSEEYADLSLNAVDLLKELIQNVENALKGEPIIKPDNYDELINTLTRLGESDVSVESKEIAPKQKAVTRAENIAKDEEDVEVPAKQPQRASDITVAKQQNTIIEKAKSSQRNNNTTDSTIRIPTNRLDRLIDMVGELVISHSMVAQDEIVNKDAHHELFKKVVHAGKIIRDLQDLSMLMRMVPLKPTFHKMARLVRDVARKSNKSIEFITKGEDVEIDRNMVAVLNDPLIHILRNAIDHGIESQEFRREKGKPKKGNIQLSAYHAGGTVIVEIKDDGNGLDRSKIIKKAISKGLIESGQNMSDREVFNLLFEPGFSTADKVTDVSGRGVGLDVVKKKIEALRGRVDIYSEEGKGSTFTLRLPLTMAITDGMLVKVGNQRYIIPTINIYLNFRPDNCAISTIAGRGEMVMLRNRLLPIVRLHRLFNIQGAVEDPTDGLLIVLDDDNKRCALLVDELLDQQQVVVKSLGSGIGKVQGISGGAILGDGRVGLILDPAEIIILAKTSLNSDRGAE